ncbi:MAG: hypothetical protein KY444_06690 [Gemmatimonadetes bacterium]|nr:hypothetical protein [Gemmatimonadota bacterium]
MSRIVKRAAGRVMVLCLAGALAGCRDGNPAAVQEVPAGRFQARITGAVTGSLQGEAVMYLMPSFGHTIELRDATTNGEVVFGPGGFGTIGSPPSLRLARGEYPIGLLSSVAAYYAPDHTAQARPFFALSGKLRVREVTDDRVVGSFIWEGSSDPMNPATRVRVEGDFNASRDTAR